MRWTEPEASISFTKQRRAGNRKNCAETLRAAMKVCVPDVRARLHTAMRAEQSGAASGAEHQQVKTREGKPDQKPSPRGCQRGHKVRDQALGQQHVESAVERWAEILAMRGRGTASAQRRPSPSTCQRQTHAA